MNDKVSYAVSISQSGLVMKKKNAIDHRFVKCVTGPELFYGPLGGITFPASAMMYN